MVYDTGQTSDDSISVADPGSGSRLTEAICCAENIAIAGNRYLECHVRWRLYWRNEMGLIERSIVRNNRCYRSDRLMEANTVLTAAGLVSCGTRCDEVLHLRVVCEHIPHLCEPLLRVARGISSD